MEQATTQTQVVFHKKKKAKHGFSAMHVIMLLFLIIYTFLLFLLLFWGLMTASKSIHDWIGWGEDPNYAGFPRYWIDDTTGQPAFISNLQRVLRHSTYTKSDGTEVGIGTMLMNSILYSLGCAFFNTLVPFVTAYACAKYRNPVSKILVTTAIVVMSIPIVGSTPAALLLTYQLNLYNHIWGQWVMKANYLGVYFLVFYAAFLSQPKAYHEEAVVDGASDFAVMTRIAMPLCMGEFGTVLLINFITFWNDYQTPFIYMPDKPTLAYNTWAMMSRMSDADLSYPPSVIMAAVILLVPVLVLFLVFQKRLLQNIDIGGIKG